MNDFPVLGDVVLGLEAHPAPSFEVAPTAIPTGWRFRGARLPEMTSRARILRASAVGGLLAGPLLVVCWIVAALAQSPGFSFINHASSDLGAQTANSPWIANQLGSQLPGLLLLLFAVGLWLCVGDRFSGRAGSILIAVVAIGAFASGFLRLDCRQMDAGCEDSSWQAVGHNINSGIVILALALAPYVLARAFSRSPKWHDRWLLTLGVGIGLFPAVVGGGAIGEGLGQFLPQTLWFAWIAVLAVRMFHLSKGGSG